jgi:hypothetical protein
MVLRINNLISLNNISQFFVVTDEQSFLWDRILIFKYYLDKIHVEIFYCSFSLATVYET